MTTDVPPRAICSHAAHLSCLPVSPGAGLDAAWESRVLLFPAAGFGATWEPRVLLFPAAGFGALEALVPALGSRTLLGAGFGAALGPCALLVPAAGFGAALESRALPIPEADVCGAGTLETFLLGTAE